MAVLAGSPVADDERHQFPGAEDGIPQRRAHGRTPM
jgi:hypothetical protein